MNSILESVGYLTVLVCFCVGAFVIGYCAWRGAADLARRIDYVRRLTSMMDSLPVPVSSETFKERPFLRRYFTGRRAN